MLTAACPHCRRRYQVRTEIVPARGIRARCPHCGALFSIVPSVDAAPSNGHAPPPVQGEPQAWDEAIPSGDEAAPVDPAPPDDQGTDLGASPVEDENIVWGEELEKARPERGVFGEVRPRVSAAGAAQDVLEAESPAPDTHTPREQARSLARALASDLLEYHSESCRIGVGEMRLVELLGRQVARSWDLYVEEVGVEFAQTTDIFQQAFNEILAGRRYF